MAKVKQFHCSALREARRWSNITVQACVPLLWDMGEINTNSCFPHQELSVKESCVFWEEGEGEKYRKSKWTFRYEGGIVVKVSVIEIPAENCSFSFIRECRGVEVFFPGKKEGKTKIKIPPEQISYLVWGEEEAQKKALLGGILGLGES